jgi:maleate isomerase
MIYGKKGKIGIICPAPGAATEMELHKVLPDGVAVLTTRIPLVVSNPDTLVKLADYAEEAAVMLAQAKPDLMVFCCTAGSFIKGLGYDKEVIKRIEKRVNIPTITTSTSVIDALTALKATKVSMVTPYMERVTEAERVFMEASGFKLTSVKCLNYEDAFTIANVDSEQIYRLVKDTVTKDAEAIFISCTGLTVMHIIDAIEKEFKIPVVTSNQTTIWAALRKINVKDKISGYGRLFNL